MVGAVDAVALPDDRFHLGRRLAFGHLAVVLGHVDDGRPERPVIGCRRLGRLLQRHQVNRQARR